VKKKLVFLIVLICILTFITGFQNAMIFGTQHAEIKSGFTMNFYQSLVNESLACNGYTGTFQEWDQRIGASPYLNASDDNDNHDAPGGAFIKEESNANQDEGWFTFNDTTEIGCNLTVNFTFRASCLDGDNDGFYVHYDITGSDPGTGTEGPLVQIASTTYTNITVTLPGKYNVTEVNNMRILLHTDNQGGGDERWVDYVVMTIYRPYRD
jgi:hypothetical protein